MRKQQYLPIGDFHVPIIETPYAIEHKEVKRTWRERLFSWPWCPWVKTKIVEQPAIYILDSRLTKPLSINVPEPYNISIELMRSMIVAHPIRAALIRNLAVETDSV